MRPGKLHAPREAATGKTASRVSVFLRTPRASALTVPSSAHIAIIITSAQTRALRFYVELGVILLGFLKNEVIFYREEYISNYRFVSYWLAPVLEMGRYTIPKLLSVPEFHTGTYEYTLYPFIFSPQFS
jgi:hypothetical protein